MMILHVYNHVFIFPDPSDTLPAMSEALIPFQCLLVVVSKYALVSTDSGYNDY
jgi:hypothetical protein